MFGGKGGLGKTTFSAATAFWLAQQGNKVLVFSVDPQASLSDIFQQDIFGKGPVKMMDNLYAQEIDADRHIRHYQDQIRKKILDMYGMEQVPEEIEQYIQAASAEPAMEESAIFDAVVDIVVGGEYDYYIYDLVPLGHALYYLSMAKVYDEWINRITKLREEMREHEEMVARIKRQKTTEEDHILTELQYIKNRINQSSQHPDRQEEDGVLLRGGAGGDDHPGHGEGGGTVCQVRRAHCRVRGQPGAARRPGREAHPALPAEPAEDAGSTTWKRSTRLSASRWWGGFRNWSATLPG